MQFVKVLNLWLNNKDTCEFTNIIDITVYLETGDITVVLLSETGMHYPAATCTLCTYRTFLYFNLYIVHRHISPHCLLRTMAIQSKKINI